MSVEHDTIIEVSRKAHNYRCAKCRYSLSEVPFDEEHRVVCPECGFAMRFVINVNLVRGDGAQIHARDSALNSGDRVMMVIAICVLVFLAVAAAVIVFG